jgi:hypothetical protein
MESGCRGHGGAAIPIDHTEDPPAVGPPKQAWSPRTNALAPVEARVLSSTGPAEVRLLYKRARTPRMPPTPFVCSEQWALGLNAVQYNELSLIPSRSDEKPFV